MALEVAYPERLSRVKIFFKLILAIPQFIVVYLLSIPLFLLTFMAWFGILFTGRYPKALFDFNAGILRWQANLFAYVALLRDEYPPFSWEPGEYPLALEIPRADRQSRFRLFIRAFAIVPNYIVFYFVQIGWFFTTFIAWFAILISGRYPAGLFKFSVGVMRWYERMAAYLYLLRDEYPPYSINANARPGNEVVSAIVGLPLFTAYVAFNLLPFFGLLGGGTTTVNVERATLQAPAALARERPSGEANNLRITLLNYNDHAGTPQAVRGRPTIGYHLVAFGVRAEKDGFWPTFYTPFLFSLRDCFGNSYSIESEESDLTFKLFWRHGGTQGDIYFRFPDGAVPCSLKYFSGRGGVTFRFQ